MEGAGGRRDLLIIRLLPARLFLVPGNSNGSMAATTGHLEFIGRWFPYQALSTITCSLGKGQQGEEERKSFVARSPRRPLKLIALPHGRRDNNTKWRPVYSWSYACPS